MPPEKQNTMSNELVLQPSEPADVYTLVLYVAGSTPRSSRAIKNLKAICEKYLSDRYILTVVDLYEEQDRAAQDQIVVAPTLVRQSPMPVRRLIGDLSEIERVLAALDLPATPPSP